MKIELIISIISLVIATGIGIYTFIISKRLRKSELINENANQRNLINESFSNSDIISPYGIKLGLKEPEEIRRYNQMVNIFFQHIQLLFLVYSNKIYFPKREIYENWIGNEIKEWILSEEKLVKTWYNLKQSKDLYEKEFISWIDKNLKIPDDLLAENTLELKSIEKEKKKANS